MIASVPDLSVAYWCMPKSDIQIAQCRYVELNDTNAKTPLSHADGVLYLKYPSVLAALHQRQAQNNSDTRTNQAPHQVSELFLKTRVASRTWHRDILRLCAVSQGQIAATSRANEFKEAEVTTSTASLQYYKSSWSVELETSCIYKIDQHMRRMS